MKNILTNFKGYNFLPALMIGFYLLLHVNHLQGQPLNWSQLSNKIGTADAHNVLVSCNGKIYSGIGNTNDNAWTEYNPTTNTWTAKTSMPGTGRHLCVSFSIGTKVYVGLGVYASAPHPTDFYQYETSTDTWTNLGAWPSNGIVGGFAWTINGKAYVGGADLSGAKGLYEFNPAGNTWTAKAPCPTYIQYTAAFTVNNKGYYSCGWNGSQDMAETFEYDPSNDTWAQKANAPVVRRQLAGFAINNMGFIACGYIYTQDVYKYDPFTNIWSIETSFPGGLAHECRATTIGNAAYFAPNKYLSVFTNDFYKASFCVSTPGAPTITSPGNQTLYVIPNTCQAIYTIADPISDDSLGATWGYTLEGVTIGSASGIADGSDATNISFNRGLTRVGLTGLDASGNATCLDFFNVFVLDNITPVITSCSNNLTINTNLNSCFATPTLTPPLVNENCAMDLGNALHFDGSNDRVSQTFFARPTNFTIEAWVKLTATGTRAIASWGSNSTNQATLTIDGGYIRYYQYGSGAYQTSNGYFGQAVNDNTWHHVAISIAGAGGTASFNIYLDGNIVTSYTGNLPNLAFSNFNIGRVAIWNWSYSGSLDEVRIWNVARTGADIKANYRKELQATTANLIQYYKFNQNVAEGNNAGTTTVLATTGSNGTLNNFALTGATSNFVSGNTLNLFSNDAPIVFPIGNTTVTWIMTDLEGNSASCNHTVTVMDNQAPSFDCSVPVIINNTPGLCTGSTILNMPIVSDNCNSKNALKFDGINDHVKVPGASIFEFDSGTIECWIKPQSVNHPQSFLSYRNNSGSATRWLFNFGANLGYIGSWNGSTYQTMANPFVANVWAHFAAVDDDSGGFKIYKNGVLIGTFANQIGTQIGGGMNLLQGIDLPGSEWLIGSLEEVRIWNVPRTQAEIAANMNNELNPQPGLVAYYRYNQGIANGSNSGEAFLMDVSGNNLNGALLNFALNGTASNWVEGVSSIIPASVIALTSNAPSTYPIGNTTVIWTATDSNGNSSTCNQTVTVVDNETPLLSSPGNQALNALANICAAIYTIADPISDNCPGSTWGYTTSGATTLSSLGNTIPAGSGSGLLSFNPGETIVTLSGTDGTNPASAASFTVTVNPIITDTSLVSSCLYYNWNGNTYTSSGTFYDTAGCHISELQLTIYNSMLLQAKAILQGPYDPGTGWMHDSLRSKEVIPLNEPYSLTPYSKPSLLETNGETINPAILLTTGPDAIVDWVFIELRDWIDPSMIISTRRALIQRDGDIVSHEDGASPVRFYQTPPGNYYVCLKHRNHHGVMTYGAFVFMTCMPTVVNFADPVMSVYIKPSILANPPRKAAGSVSLLLAGDANNNKNVKYNGLSNDKDAVLTAIGGLGFMNSTVWNTYRVEDVNMDGKVRYNNVDNDRLVILNTVGVNTPNMVIGQHTPN